MSLLTLHSRLMDVEGNLPPDASFIDREKTAPFLVRAFIKIGGFHRVSLFEDGTLPTTDEQQLFTWKNATLRELLTTLRTTAPTVPEYRHPLARYSFRTLYADPTNKGQIAHKDLGTLYGRDVLGDSTALAFAALNEEEPMRVERPGEKPDRTLDELRFHPGDYLCISVLLPKGLNTPSELSLKGNAQSANGRGWTQGDSGRPLALPAARGAPHWRARPGVAPPVPRREREDRDRPPPPPARGGRSPPPRRGRDDDRPPRRSFSRSRSPPRRRRYD